MYLNTCLKGTVSVISNDPLCNNGIFQFTTVSLKALCDQVWIKYQCFCFIKLFTSFVGSMRKWQTHFLLILSKREIIRFNTFRLRKTTVSYTFLIRSRFQGYRGGSLEITLTVPLIFLSIWLDVANL